MSSVVADIGQLLGDTVTGWDYATDRPLNPGETPVVVAGNPPDDVAVVVNTYPGGPEPDTRNGTEYPRLQVRTRHTDPLAALDLDRAAYDALQATPGKYPVALTGWLLTDCYSVTGEAQPLGQDSGGRWEYVRNYQLTVQPV